MNYIDLHCDALTKEGVLQVTGESLREGGCRLQCFAIFLTGKEDRFARTLALIEKYAAFCREQGITPVRERLSKGVCALLTVEGGGAAEGSLSKLDELYRRGVKSMTLVWNEENELGFPAFPDYEGVKVGRVSPARREEESGLTEFGRAAVERMCDLGMIPDVSHGSDLLVIQTAEICKRRGKPLAATHSGAEQVFSCARNLKDEGIRAIADCGGIVGLDFVSAFTSQDLSSEGQREALLRHAEHILRIGGEDVLAIGSDFDGAPVNPYLKSPRDMPLFLEELQKKFGGKTAEKIAFSNAFRALNLS